MISELSTCFMYFPLSNRGKKKRRKYSVQIVQLIAESEFGIWVMVRPFIPIYPSYGFTLNNLAGFKEMQGEQITRATQPPHLPQKQ